MPIECPLIVVVYRRPRNWFEQFLWDINYFVIIFATTFWEHFCPPIEEDLELAGVENLVLFLEGLWKSITLLFEVVILQYKFYNIAIPNFKLLSILLIVFFFF